MHRFVHEIISSTHPYGPILPCMVDPEHHVPMYVSIELGFKADWKPLYPHHTIGEKTSYC